MELKIKRIFLGEDYTIGRFFINNEKICDTLEDKVRDLSKEEKVYGKTAIPAGRYQVIVDYSNRFKRTMPLLLNVPKFDGVRFHNGVTAEHTEGCPLVGENKVKGKLLNSRECFYKIFAILEQAVKTEKVWITIA